jgi:hypothetical protein
MAAPKEKRFTEKIIRMVDRYGFFVEIEIAHRIAAKSCFKLLPRRWVVERTFSWMTRWRRPVRDYEHRTDVSGAMIHVAMGSLLLRRISHWSHSQTDSKIYDAGAEECVRIRCGPGAS